MLRKTAMVLLTCLVAVGLLLAGCAPKATPTPTPLPKVSLKLWGAPLWTGITGMEPDGKPEDYWAYKIDQFEKEHPNVEIALEMLDFATYKDKLGAAIESKDYPDVSWMCSGNAPVYADLGVLVPLETYIDDAWRKDVPEGAWQNATYRDHIWYAPSNVHTNALIINRDLFKERGVPLPAADGSWTWDEFEQAVQKLTFDRNGDGRIDVYGTAICCVNPEMEWMNFHYMFNRGARFMDPTMTKFAFNDDKACDACQWMLDLQDKRKLVPPGGAGLSLDDCHQMLYRGQIAIFHGAPYVIAGMEQMVAAGQIERPADLIMVQYPHFPGGRMVTDLDSCGFFVWKYDDPNRRTMAVELARFLTNTESLKEWKAGRFLPARFSAGKGLYEGDAVMDAMANMTQYGDGNLWSRVVDMYLYANQMNAVLPAVLNHTQTCKEALDQFVKESQAIFDANYPK